MVRMLMALSMKPEDPFRVRRIHGDKIAQFGFIRLGQGMAVAGIPKQYGDFLFFFRDR